MLAIMTYFGYYPSLRLFALPLFMIVAFMAALGVGLWLSALNVQFRDIRFTVPFMMQLWMYSTPIVYSVSVLGQLDTEIAPHTLQMIWAINPMVGVVEGFRWAIGVGNPNYGFPIHMILISATSAAIVFVGGMFYFRRMEKTFADVV